MFKIIGGVIVGFAAAFAFGYLAAALAMVYIDKTKGKDADKT